MNLKILGILFLVPLSFGIGQASHDDKKAESIISQHTPTFNAPPARIPARYATDAPLLGNGFTGIALSGPPEAQVLYVARNDFWRLKSAYDESFPLVLGKIELSLPSLSGASYRVEQKLYEAVTTARFQKREQTVYYKIWLAATDDILVAEVGMTSPGSMEGSVKLSLPGEKEIHVEPPEERAFPYVVKTGRKVDGIAYLSRACEESVDIKTKAAMALRVIGSEDGNFSISEGHPARFVGAFSSNFKSPDCEKAVTDKLAGLSAERIAQLEQSHRQWWKDYWEKSYVHIPDPEIERQYYVSLYSMAACSRDPDFPPSIFGTWITGERPWWNGDYHLNYNHEAPYYALYSANRLEQAEPCFGPLLQQIERGKYYSEKVTGIKDGIMLPVGIGPLGIETTRRSPFMEKYKKGWIDGKIIEDEGMFWGQKSNSAYATVNLSMQFYRTWDESFTKRVYPFVKGVATFWEGYLKYEDNRYVIYNDAIHEGTLGNKNPILSLGLVKMVMQTACDMSKLLGVDEERRARWERINTHISEFPLQKKSDKTVFRYTEEGTAWWDNNTLGIQHIYPAGQIGLNSPPELLAIAQNTVDVMQRWIDYNGANSFFPAAVRVGYAPETILEKLRLWSQNTYSNGFQRNNPHGIENLSTVPNTINEMLCSGHQGIVRVFPVWPQNKDALFQNIRTEGAFLVSAELRSGTITNLTIVSEKGRMLNLKNPWKARRVKMTVEPGNTQQTLEGDILTIPTAKGATYRFEPAPE
jgi:hypothetical protein